MRQLSNMISDRLAKGERVVLATVLETSGSVPRGTGAAMAVLETGETVGTVGGGAAELVATAFAGAMPASESSAVRQYNSMSGSGEPGAACGGTVTILFQRLGAPEAPLFLRASAAAGGREPVFLVRHLQQGRVVSMALSDTADLADPTHAGYTVSPDGSAVLTEPLAAEAQVYLFGAGHVAQRVAPELARVGFCVTVIDAREALLQTSCFDCARMRILADPVETAARLSLGTGDYAVVMASNHETDFLILEQLLRQQPTYIGCIGSRQKIAMAKRRLCENGVSAESFDRRVHAPIGLPIRAETPAEIAVSIAAEMILFRAEQ